MDTEKLASAAGAASWPEIQRVGNLFELVGQGALSEPLAAMLDKRRKRPVLLRPDSDSRRTHFDKRWSRFINEEVESDL